MFFMIGIGEEGTLEKSTLLEMERAYIMRCVKLLLLHILKSIVDRKPATPSSAYESSILYRQGF